MPQKLTATSKQGLIFDLRLFGARHRASPETLLPGGEEQRSTASIIPRFPLTESRNL